MSLLRCAVLDDYQNVALRLADWSQIADRVAVTVHDHHFENEDSLVEAINNSEILVVMRERTPLGRSLIERLPNLKLIVTTGMRNASIDLNTARDRGIVVCGTASSSDPPTELTWALILGLARSIVAENDSFRTNGRWQSTIGADLQGKQLGILGLGKIGTRVARIGAAFGMSVAAWSQNLTADHATSVGARLATSKYELLESSDFVSIHLVLSDRTRGLIGRDELRHMRRTAYLVNTSRAAIVDTNALIEALKQRWIAGAATDVFETEPVPDDDLLRKIPNLLATPHLGYVTNGNYQTYFRDVVDDISAFLAGSPVRMLLTTRDGE